MLSVRHSIFVPALTTAIVLSLTALATTAAHAQDLLVGDYFANTIWRVAPDGTKTQFAQPAVFSGIRLDGFGFDSAGNLYAARFQGGTLNGSDPNNGIIKVSPTGVVTNFATSVPGLPLDTAVDSAGNVYVGGDTTGQIRRYSPTGVSLGVFATVAGNGYNLGFDGGGNLFVVSNSNGQIRSFSPTGVDLGLFTTLSGASSVGFDAAGNVYVGTGSGAINRYTSAGQSLGVFAAVSGARFDALVFGASGDLFASNLQTSGGDIKRFSAAGTSLGTFSSGIAAPLGLAFVPTISATGAPEPGSLALVLIPCVLMAARFAALRRR